MKIVVKAKHYKAAIVSHVKIIQMRVSILTETGQRLVGFFCVEKCSDASL
jgi:hypothetical protein